MSVLYYFALYGAAWSVFAVAGPPIPSSGKLLLFCAVLYAITLLDRAIRKRTGFPNAWVSALPSIASRADRLRDRIAHMGCVLGWLVILAAFENWIGAVHVMTGAALLAAASVLDMVALSCPQCSAKWRWRAASEQPLTRASSWLSGLQACPQCGFSPAGGTDLSPAQQVIGR